MSRVKCRGRVGEEGSRMPTSQIANMVMRVRDLDGV